jgi:uncharacterized cupredoxin-like copper-binding protein
MRTRWIVASGALASGALVLAACGGGGDGGTVARPDAEGVVAVTMREMRYTPDRIEIPAGRPVTFRFTNAGALAHEAFVGTASEQATHEQQMRHAGDTSTTEMHSEGEGDGDGEVAAGPFVRVEPGRSAELEYTPKESGDLLIGCHEAGHWGAGMVARVRVT